MLRLALRHWCLTQKAGQSRSLLFFSIQISLPHFRHKWVGCIVVFRFQSTDCCVSKKHVKWFEKLFNAENKNSALLKSSDSFWWGNRKLTINVALIIHKTYWPVKYQPKNYALPPSSSPVTKPHFNHIGQQPCSIMYLKREFSRFLVSIA